MRRKTVAQKVRLHLAGVQPRPFRIELDEVPHRLARDGFAAARKEHLPAALGADEGGPRQNEVFLQRLHRRAAHRHHAILGALAGNDAQEPVLKIQILDPHRADLAHAQAARIGQFHDRAVAQALRARGGGGVEQLFEVLYLKRAGEFAGESRTAQAVGKGAAGHALVGQVAEEAAHGGGLARGAGAGIPLPRKLHLPRLHHVRAKAPPVGKAATLRRETSELGEVVLIAENRVFGAALLHLHKGQVRIDRLGKKRGRGHASAGRGGRFRANLFAGCAHRMHRGGPVVEEGRSLRPSAAGLSRPGSRPAACRGRARRSRGAGGCGSGDASCAGPWPRSGGCVRASR